MDVIDEEVRNEPHINPIPKPIVQYQLNSSIRIEENKDNLSDRNLSEGIPEESFESIEPPPLPAIDMNIDNGMEPPLEQGDPGYYYDYYQRERMENERRFFLNFAIVRGIYEFIYLTPVTILYLVNDGEN